MLYVWHHVLVFRYMWVSVMNMFHFTDLCNGIYIYNNQNPPTPSPSSPTVRFSRGSPTLTKAADLPSPWRSGHGRSGPGKRRSWSFLYYYFYYTYIHIYIYYIIYSIYIYTKDLKMHQTYSPSLIAINRLTRAQLLESIMLSHTTGVLVTVDTEMLTNPLRYLEITAAANETSWIHKTLGTFSGWWSIKILNHILKDIVSVYSYMYIVKYIYICTQLCIYYIILYYIILHYITLYYIILHYIILYYILYIIYYILYIIYYIFYIIYYILYIILYHIILYYINVLYHIILSNIILMYYII